MFFRYSIHWALSLDLSGPPQGSLSRTTLIFMYSFHSPTSPFFFFTSNLSGRQMVDENTELNPYLPRDSSHWFCVHGREFSTQKKTPHHQRYLLLSVCLDRRKRASIRSLSGYTLGDGSYSLFCFRYQIPWHILSCFKRLRASCSCTLRTPPHAFERKNSKNM